MLLSQLCKCYELEKYFNDIERRVGNTGFEPATPALSRRCSKPTELISH
jgi:hypothetical protein